MSAAGPTAPTLRAAPAAWVDRAQVALLLGVLTALPFVLGDQPTQLTSAEETGLLAPEGDPRKQVVLMGTYALSGLLLLRRASAAARGLGLAWALLLAWCVASVAWADDPMLAVRRSLALAGTVTAGVHAGATLRLEDAPRLMRAVVAAVLGASVLVAIALPAQGLDPEGRLRGVFAHKNALGTFAALGAIAVAATASARPTSAGGSTLRDAALLALCAACLLAARAATPLAAGVFATGLVVLARTGRADRGGLLLAIVGATAVAGMALPFVAERIGRVALLFGRDADFSGRTLVWEFSIGFLRATPWLGFGYGTFWNGGAGIVFWRWSGFPVPHAHNGWLQLALDAGVVATVLLAAAVAGTARRAASLHRAGRPRGAAWVWGFLGLCLAMNLTESFLFVPNDPLTVVLVWTAVAVGLAARGDGGAAPRGASGG